MLSPPADSLTSDLPGTHFDGRPINRERPFLVGLGRVIRRPTNDFKLDREPNVDPMFSAKPHGRPFFQCCRAPELRTQAVCDASQDISPFLAPPLEHPRRHNLVVTQGGDEGDRPIFNCDVAHPSKPGGSKTVAAGYGRQFVSALLAPANSRALCQASAPTNPRSCQTQIASTCSSRLRETVRLSPWQGAVQQPLAVPPHVQRLP